MTEAQSLQLQLRVELHSAAHIGTGLGLGQILDDRIVQGPHPQYPNTILPYLPGSTLKGRLRYHLRRLAAIFALPEVEDRLFGSPERLGDLRVADAHLSDLALVGQMASHKGGDAPNSGRPSPLGNYLVRGARSFVSLSRGRRVARDERLFRIELAETGLVFTSTIHGALSAPEPKRDLALLLAATRDLTHLGGHKGRGLGRCAISIDHVRLNDQPAEWRGLLEKWL